MKYKFEDIIFNITEKKKPVEEDKYNYIGLEHLESGNLFISKWGSDTAPEGEKIVMKKGDILFGKRRAYQKKVAISPIDGIFSAHGMVLRPKEDVICKEFLPFFISSETFLNEAIRISVGGLSPTVNWKDIKELEFDLPSLAEQKVLAEILWAAYEVKQSYLKMIAATEEMVKSQFIEMFGDISINSKAWPVEKLANVADIKIGPFGSLIHQRDYQEGGHCLINPSQIINNKIVPDSKVAVTEYKYQELLSYSVSIGDIILGRRGEMGRAGIIEEEGMLCGTGSMVIRPKDNGDSLFLHLFITSPHSKEWLENNSVGTTMMNLNTQIVGNMEIPILPANLKQQFVAIANQADKSISELRKSIDAIDKVIKSLINENL